MAGHAIFLLVAALTWRSHVISHEMIYLLGSRRIADPTFLAADFTWFVLPPTSFLFDHIVAPLWSWLDEFAIINIGRFVVWAVTAWSIVALARALRLPAWSTVVGFAAWLFWRQTLVTCGAPFEGFQVKSASYPLVFFSLAFALRGMAARAGLSAGLATAFHAVIGGWTFLALLVSMLASWKRFPSRRIATLLLASAPFIVPVVLASGQFRNAGVTGDDRARMDEVYVTIAAPFCCDPDHFMSSEAWIRVAIVFTIAPLLIFLWCRRDEAWLLGGFVTALIFFFLLAEVAQRLGLYWFLAAFPCQMGASLPAFFMFLILPAWLRQGLRAGRFTRIVAVLALVGSAWLLYERRAVQRAIRTPGAFITELRQPRWGGPPTRRHYGKESVYSWIRANTPRESVFITPLLMDFWPYAERAQVASTRHPPFDRRVIEWNERLQAMGNLDSEGYNVNREDDLTIEDLRGLRENYGATHYLTKRRRDDLAGYLLFESDGFSIYDVSGLTQTARAAE